jgi:hypothetical protein
MIIPKYVEMLDLLCELLIVLFLPGSSTGMNFMLFAQLSCGRHLDSGRILCYTPGREIVWGGVKG